MGGPLPAETGPPHLPGNCSFVARLGVWMVSLQVPTSVAQVRCKYLHTAPSFTALDPWPSPSQTGFAAGNLCPSPAPCWAAPTPVVPRSPGHRALRPPLRDEGFLPFPPFP